jgi:pimeloyl-ACP methyl ester carboxylesterase
VLVSLLAASCGGDDDGDSAGADTTEGSPDDQVPWEECGGAECATVDVPLDYEQPDGDTISIDVLRVPASGDRIGALFVNPGGPGATATDFATYVAGALPEVSERFDVVGVNPRGVGASAIDCQGDFTELYGQDYSIDSPEDEQALLDVSEQYVTGCETNAGDMLPHMGTIDVARDLDTVRELMGDDQLNYFGVSYGTAIGQVYAQEFPDRVRSMVIDGIVEVGLPGVEQAAEQAAGFEGALEAFADWCDGDDSCAINPDAIGAIDELTAQVEEAPIPAEPRDLGPGELNLGMGQSMYVEDFWPGFAEAVSSALDGDGSAMVSLADDYLTLASFDVYFAVNCLDNAWPATPDELLAAGEAANAEAPHFGQAIVNDYVRCSMWPVPAEPLPEITAPGTPPIVVVSTTNDPATPYESGVRVAERLESGVLLTNHGEGHGIVSSGKPCIDDAVTSYLIDLEPPEDGTECE